MYSFIDNPYLTESALTDITKLLEGSDKEYEAFFKKALAKFHAKSPDDLKGSKQKEFFDYVEKNYKAVNEEAKPTHYTDPRTGQKQSLDKKAHGVRAQIQAIQKKYPVNPTTGTHKPYSDADKTRIEALRKQLKQHNESCEKIEEGIATGNLLKVGSFSKAQADKVVKASKENKDFVILGKGKEGIEIYDARSIKDILNSPLKNKGIVRTFGLKHYVVDEDLLKKLKTTYAFLEESVNEEVMNSVFPKNLKKGTLYKVLNGSKVMQGVYTGKNEKEEYTFKTVAGNVSFPEKLINKRVYTNNDKK